LTAKAQASAGHERSFLQQMFYTKGANEGMTFLSADGVGKDPRWLVPDDQCPNSAKLLHASRCLKTAQDRGLELRDECPILPLHLLAAFSRLKRNSVGLCELAAGHNVR
jgi:hypothetical protein